MEAATHQSIEIRAYELWEQAGRPFGRAEEFWFIASTELTTNGTAPKKAKKPAASKAKAAPSKSKAAAAPVAKPKKKTASKKN